jgi:hypothetical protein
MTLHESNVTAPIFQPQKDLEFLIETLERVSEYLDQRSDVRDGDNGEPMPNEAMLLQRDVELCIRKAEGYR